MSIPDVSHSLPNNIEPLLQESGSLLGKIITRIYTTTSYLISSIGSMAQSILSNFIYVGTVGHYKLDDLKDCFSVKRSKDRSTASSKRGDIEETSISEPNSTLKEVKARLNRHTSRISVGSATLRKIRSHSSSKDSQYPSLYPKLEEMVKLASYSKTPEERLAELKNSLN
ncbi:hypothetical protein [Candidatus Rhabdochlamydia porcellionis]|jgi:hypothetical protein|uniref:Uncharacterized protein n=1 Tax=Candidatus Rhabdochlamydia porcellionis TaxID=225148 RepID=A0ABX8YYJ2_9BACT|nr:hypothetical protein [Candidatus Rhabdochlamydia porcellionis]QZA58394.1 hypothetical protein RHAB15C_0000267 [Candidatus Rhabdochlamydia porcellionis]